MAILAAEGTVEAAKKRKEHVQVVQTPTTVVQLLYVQIFQAAKHNSSRYLLTFSSDTDSQIPSFNGSAWEPNEKNHSNFLESLQLPWCSFPFFSYVDLICLPF